MRLINGTESTIYRQYAAICRDVYVEAPNAGAGIVDIGGFRADIIPALDTHAIVAFRGSSDPVEWLADFEMSRQLMHKWGWVHAGFDRAWHELHDAVFCRLMTGGFRVVTWIGHSLGAAIATLAAADWSFDTDEVVTFGSPRVGDAEFARCYQRCLGHLTKRFHYLLDPIPLLPSMLGFRHVCQSTWWDGTAWQDGMRLWPWLKAVFAPGDLRQAIADHHIGNYLNHV